MFVFHSCCMFAKNLDILLFARFHGTHTFEKKEKWGGIFEEKEKWGGIFEGKEKWGGIFAFLENVMSY